MQRYTLEEQTWDGNYEEIKHFEFEQTLIYVSISVNSQYPDGVQPGFSQHLELEVKTALFSIFNNVLEDKTLPSGNIEVVILPTADNYCYLYTSSYRPITKSSYIGKLLERVI